MDKIYNRLAVMLSIIRVNKDYLPEDNYKAMLTVLEELFDMVDQQLGEREEFNINSSI